MIWVRLILIAIALWLGGGSAWAQDRYASIIVDADSLDVLHARQVDAARHPASLTKIMTLHLVFEAVERGELSLDGTVSVSKTAARTPPVNMGLKAGQSISIDTLIQAVAVRSSNDAAVALAEAVSGSQDAFAARMTEKARELGMQRTVFRNASGLPDAEQVTTARDMAKLAHATLTRFPQHYHYFGQQSFRGKRNTNRLLTQRDDVDGFKTGYTRASGYNLVISATRDGRRLIAVVLGGASSGSRNAHMDDLIERGFAVMATQPPKAKTVKRPIPEPEAGPARFVTLRTADGLVRVQTAGTPQTSVTADWAVQIDGFLSDTAAAIAADRLIERAGRGQPVPRSRVTPEGPRHAARVEDLPADIARQLCADHEAILGLSGRRCLVLSTIR